jgi:hypothetical protein
MFLIMERMSLFSLRIACRLSWANAMFSSSLSRLRYELPVLFGFTGKQHMNMLLACDKFDNSAIIYACLVKKIIY